ncbi:hypothetical protein [Scardovia wiggsiae]|uniref:hypothetical protein n=1 Tax=Scardovia wiggsiae TaxID=230143 RepID=UPI00374EEEBE
MADNSFITGNMFADDADGIFKDEHLGHPAQTREPARLPSKKNSSLQVSQSLPYWHLSVWVRRTL